MVFGKIVTIQVMDIDRYGRTVADILVEGKSLNKELVKADMPGYIHNIARLQFVRNGTSTRRRPEHRR